MSANWGVDDPAAVTGSDEDKRWAFFRAYSQLANRIAIFLNLPLDKLDGRALQKKLDDIGST